MKKWAISEDKKYSWLYERSYPPGNPMGCVKKYSLPNTLSCIDLGCGRASLSTYFNNYTGVDVSEYIISKNKKTRSGKYHHSSLDELDFIQDYFDIAICSDVMEHIPPEELDSVLSSISNLKVETYFFVISTRKSVLLDEDNNNLHLSVFSSDFWRKKLNIFFTINHEEVKTTLYTVKCLKK